MKVALLLLIACLLMNTGCVYSHVRMPLDTDFQETSLGEKEGHAHMQSFLWLVAWGDAGAHAAAKAGGITVIRHADTEVFNVLFGAYSRITTIAYGD